MNLGNCKKSKEYIVEDSMLKLPIKRRLEAMGLIEGTRIRKIDQGLDGSVIFMVRGSRLAVGKNIADNIIVHEACKTKSRSSKRSSREEMRRGKARNVEQLI